MTKHALQFLLCAALTSPILYGCQFNISETEEKPPEGISQTIQAYEVEINGTHHTKSKEMMSEEDTQKMELKSYIGLDPLNKNMYVVMGTNGKALIFEDQKAFFYNLQEKKWEEAQNHYEIGGILYDKDIHHQIIQDLKRSNPKKTKGGEEEIYSIERSYSGKSPDIPWFYFYDFWAEYASQWSTSHSFKNSIEEYKTNETYYWNKEKQIITKAEIKTVMSLKSSQIGASIIESEYKIKIAPTTRETLKKKLDKNYIESLFDTIGNPFLPKN